MVKLGKGKEFGVRKERNIHQKREERDVSNWIQRLKQHVDSLEKRLDAIERRLSEEPFKMVKFGGEEKTEKIKESGLREFTSKIEKEIDILKKEIEEMKTREIKFKTERKGSNEVVISLKRKGEETTSTNYAKDLANIERRLERLEKSRKAAATVKVGKIEVPFEVTGLIGGFLAFLIAILLFEGYKNLVISPPFVMFIGLVLLTATALKTYLINVSKR